MEISPALGVIIMMNNYFHDVATALLAASGVALWVMMKRYESGNAGVDAYFMRIYRGMTRLAKFSLLFILIGGVPRTLFYRSFEWANAVGHGQIPALIVKHIMVFAFVALGVNLWIKLGRKVKAIQASAGIVRD